MKFAWILALIIAVCLVSRGRETQRTEQRPGQSPADAEARVRETVREFGQQHLHTPLTGTGVTTTFGAGYPRFNSSPYTT